MNFEFKKGTIKGEEVLSLTISPSDNLEREFFNTLFSTETEAHTVANSDQIVIKKKEANLSDN